MDHHSVEWLLEQLKNPDDNLRQRATAQLWKIWFKQKGEVGLEMLRRIQGLCEMGDMAKALEMLTETIEFQPDFAEAWNRRALLYYTQGDYEKSRQDCEKVVELNPNHFGAWHGLGLCHAALGNYVEAIQAFRQALEIQPYALVNQKLILECTARLN